MINKLYLYFLNIFVSIIDSKNKKKIIKYFKKIFKNKELIIIDVGAHTGETIKIFSKNLKIKKIFAFEANPLILNKLKKNTRNLTNQNKLEILNYGLGDIERPGRCGSF